MVMRSHVGGLHRRARGRLFFFFLLLMGLAYSLRPARLRAGIRLAFSGGLFDDPLPETKWPRP